MSEMRRTGMKGRIGIFEVFYVDEEVADLLGRESR